MSVLNCKIYQRWRVSTVADIELILLIVHLIVRQMSLAQSTTTRQQLVNWIEGFLRLCQWVVDQGGIVGQWGRGVAFRRAVSWAVTIF